MNALSEIAPQPVHRPPLALNRLERTGWSTVAANHLRVNSGEASVLCELACSAGQVVTYERLASLLRGGDRQGFSLDAGRRVSTRMGRIRGALEDMGIPRSAITNASGVGYLMATDHAAALRQMIEGAA